MVHINSGQRTRRGGSGSGRLVSENSGRSRLGWFHLQISPRIDFGAEIHFHAGVFALHALPFVFHHVLEVVFDIVQGARVVNVNGAKAVGQGAAVVREQGLALVDGLDFAFVKVRGYHSRAII